MSALESLLYIGRGIDNTSDEFVLAVKSLHNVNEKYLGSVTWKEFV
jgi:hypothetical protein